MSRAATESGAMLRVAEVAGRLSVKADQVRDWISDGQLVGVNVAANPRGRPRWRVPADALDEFIARRAVVQSGKPVAKRRRRDPGVIDFF